MPMAETNHLEQDDPNPICGIQNDFSRAWIARGVGETRRAAIRAAEAKLLSPLVVDNQPTAFTTHEGDGDKARKQCTNCPENDFDLSDIQLKTLATVRLDGKRGLPAAEQRAAPHVAYVSGFWKIKLDCEGYEGNQPELGDSEALVQIGYEPGIACGDTRVYSGCVLSKVIVRGKKTAKKTAITNAEEAADVARTAFDFTDACPDECSPGEFDPDPGIRRAFVTIVRIQQAKPDMYVAYGAGIWEKIVICRVPEEDDEGEGEDGGNGGSGKSHKGPPKK